MARADYESSPSLLQYTNKDAGFWHPSLFRNFYKCKLYFGAREMCLLISDQNYFSENDTLQRIIRN